MSKEMTSQHMVFLGYSVTRGLMPARHLPTMPQREAGGNDAKDA